MHASNVILNLQQIMQRQQTLGVPLQEKESSKKMAHQPYRLLERSVFSDRMVFVESLKDSNYMSEMELTIYDSW